MYFIAEHVLFLISLGFGMEHKINTCNLTVTNKVEYFYRTTRGQIFYVFPFYYDVMVVWLAVSCKKIYIKNIRLKIIFKFIYFNFYD